MQIQRFTAGAALALAIAFASAPASAAIIVDTGKPVGSSWVLNATESLAAKFTVTSATTLTDLTGFMYAYSAPGTFTVALRADDGKTPGEVLFSDTAVAKLPFAFYGVHGVSWLVGPGSYWLAFEVRPGDTMDGYMPFGSPSPLADGAYTEDGVYYEWDTLNLGVRINGDAVAVVPEPASWALMLTGFLGAGAALRAARRRQAALAA
jgi:hypothetical protein